MKIIARANNTVLMEASTNEVNMLAGKELYRYNNYRQEYDLAPREGTTFNIVSGISQLHHNKNRSAEIQRLKEHLRSIILQLELVEPFMNEPEPIPADATQTESVS